MNVAAPARRPLARLLASVYADATAACDGARLVRAALENPGPSAALAQARSVHVLALGKVALPMLEGLRDALSDAQIPTASGLVITSAALSAGAALPSRYALVTGEHPVPGAGSLAAGHAARSYVAALSPDALLVVLLSGGGSALACLPAGALTLADKVATVKALAKSGASIHELNAVRKHLSAIKGGQLGARARGPVLVLALSDVTDDDLSVIASGPFHSDPTTFADALSILGDRRISVPAAVREHLEAGAAGRVHETVKPSAQLEIAHHVVGTPSDVVRAARAAIARHGGFSDDGPRLTGATVESLAADYAARALQAPGTPGLHVTVGNGEPRVVLPTHLVLGRGGRATHLALLVAKALRGQPDRAFLAAGTDDRDGDAEGNGAVVDGQTWDEALALGLDPQAAIDGYDSATLLARLGALVSAPGRSNLLDLHLLGRAGVAVRSESATRDDRA